MAEALTYLLTNPQPATWRAFCWVATPKGIEPVTYSLYYLPQTREAMNKWEIWLQNALA